jgi:hypothetical protein
MTEGVRHFYVSGQGIFNKSTKGNKDTHTPWATYLWQGRQRRGLELNTYYSGAWVQIWYLWLVLYSDKKLLQCGMYFSPPLDRCYNVWKSGPECIFSDETKFHMHKWDRDVWSMTSIYPFRKVRFNHNWKWTLFYLHTLFFLFHWISKLL